MVEPWRPSDTGVWNDFPNANLLPNFQFSGTPTLIDTHLLDLVAVSRAGPALTYAPNSAGLLVGFAPNAARITDLGLLVEESRTNIITWSQDLTGGNWVPANVTVQTSGLTPVGGAAQIIIQNSLASDYISQNQTAAANSAVSLYIKNGTSLQSRVAIGSSGLFIDWTGAVPSQNSGSYSVSNVSFTPAGNGWYRAAFNAVLAGQYFSACPEKLSKLQPLYIGLGDPD